MLRKIVTLILIVVFYLLQSTLFHAFSLASVSPNLMIILVFAAGFMRGKKTGMYVGFFAGLLIDCFTGSVIGFQALLYMYIGYFNGIFHKLFYDEDVTLPLGLVILSDFIYSFVFYVMRFLLRNRLDFTSYLIHVIFPEMLYTVIIAILIYRLLFKLNKALEEHEKRSETKFD